MNNNDLIPDNLRHICLKNPTIEYENFHYVYRKIKFKI